MPSVAKFHHVDAPLTPRFDPTRTTGVTAANPVFEMLCALADRLRME